MSAAAPRSAHKVAWDAACFLEAIANRTGWYQNLVEIAAASESLDEREAGSVLAIAHMLADLLDRLRAGEERFTSLSATLRKTVPNCGEFSAPSGSAKVANTD